MYNALPLHLAPHHITATTFYIASFHIESTGIIPNHTTFHVTPFLTTSHISYHTSTSSRSTLFHFAIPYFKSYHIGHIMNHTTNITHWTPFHITDVPHNATFHVLHATTVSDHTIYWPHHLCIALPHLTTFYTTLHRISHAPHLASFHHI